MSRSGCPTSKQFVVPAVSHPCISTIPPHIICQTPHLSPTPCSGLSSPDEFSHHTTVALWASLAGQAPLPCPAPYGNWRTEVEPRDLSCCCRNNGVEQQYMRGSPGATNSPLTSCIQLTGHQLV